MPIGSQEKRFLQTHEAILKFPFIKSNSAKAVGCHLQNLKVDCLVGLPDLANKNTGCSIKFDFQMKQ